MGFVKYAFIPFFNFDIRLCHYFKILLSDNGKGVLSHDIKKRAILLFQDSGISLFQDSAIS